MTRAALLLPCLMLLSCSRTEPAQRARGTQSATSGASPEAPSNAPSSAASPAPIVPLSSALSRPAPARLVAIGDLHGDLAATKRALTLAGAIDEREHWSGGTLVVVQTGDCIDRGDDDRGVLDFLQALREQAKQAGGELILLNGNHELMNVEHDFRYVTQTSAAQFASEGGRAAAFAPTGSYARLLATHPLFIKVGDSLFVHGGILAKHVAYGLDRMDDEVRAWLRAERPDIPPAIAEADGVVWTRAYSIEPSAADCAELRLVLEQLSAKRMVVGHTVQPQGISSACDGMVWRIDVGLSKFYGGPMQVLELAGDAAHVLSAPAAASTDGSP